VRGSIRYVHDVFPCLFSHIEKVAVSLSREYIHELSPFATLNTSDF
jgi:hypothetical protein